jgi:hypothetical protein
MFQFLAPHRQTVKRITAEVQSEISRLFSLYNWTVDGETLHTYAENFKNILVKKKY